MLRGWTMIAMGFDGEEWVGKFGCLRIPRKRMDLGRVTPEFRVFKRGPNDSYNVYAETSAIGLNVDGLLMAKALILEVMLNGGDHLNYIHYPGR